MQQLRVRQLADWLADQSRPQPVLLDVREAWEVELCHLEASLHMPMHTVPLRHADELRPDQDIVVICHHGGRSMQVAMFLESRGFTAVQNLTGGINAWAGEVDPSMRRY